MAIAIVCVGTRSANGLRDAHAIMRLHTVIVIHHNTINSMWEHVEGPMWIILEELTRHVILCDWKYDIYLNKTFL